MSPYSGLVELCEKKGLLVKDGNRLKYIDRFGKEHKHYRKDWTGENLDLVMAEWATENINSQEETVKEKNERSDTVTS